jgi:hypothetical protein
VTRIANNQQSVRQVTAQALFEGFMCDCIIMYFSEVASETILNMPEFSRRQPILAVKVTTLQRSMSVRPLTIMLSLASLLCSSAAQSSQINYDLFPGYGGKQGYPPHVDYRAYVVSYRDNKYYVCVASYDLVRPASPTLTCTLGGSFDPPLLNGADVKTVQALGGPRAGPSTEEALASFFWQIDQTNGKVQFCMPIQQMNCAAFQIP